MATGGTGKAHSVTSDSLSRIASSAMTRPCTFFAAGLGAHGWRCDACSPLSHELVRSRAREVSRLGVEATAGESPAMEPCKFSSCERQGNFIATNTARMTKPQ